jgi:hypothetical protein
MNAHRPTRRARLGQHLSAPRRPRPVGTPAEQRNRVTADLVRLATTR